MTTGTFSIRVKAVALLLHQRFTIAIVAAVSLSLLALPAAQAVQQANRTPAVKAHPKKPKQVRTIQQSAGYVPPGCNKWPYVNMAPPCQSTWPAGDPNYHGSRPGPGP